MLRAVFVFYCSAEKKLQWCLQVLSEAWLLIDTSLSVELEGLTLVWFLSYPPLNQDTKSFARSGILITVLLGLSVKIKCYVCQNSL